MFTFTNQINSFLEQEFGSEKAFEKALKEQEFYKFSGLSQPQFSKVLLEQPQSIFIEQNGKKLLSKVQEMIFSHFNSQNTQYYFYALLFPSFSQKKYEQRKEIFSQLSTFESFDIPQIKSLKDLDKFSSKLRVPFRLVTCDQAIENFFFDTYRLSVEYIPEKNLEEAIQFFDTSTIMISDDYTGLEIPEYTKKEFVALLKGMMYVNNKDSLKFLTSVCSSIKNISSYENLARTFGFSFNLDLDFKKLHEKLQSDLKSNLNELKLRIQNLKVETENLNKELKDIIAQKKLSLDGDELLELVNSGDMAKLQEKLQGETKAQIDIKEQEIKDFFKKFHIQLSHIFESKHYPLKVDEEIYHELEESLDLAYQKSQISLYEDLGSFDLVQIKSLWNFVYFLDFLQGVSSFSKKFRLTYPQLGESFVLEEGRNIFIENPSPVTYGLGTQNPTQNLQGERVSVLTGANSGGKTTLLEMHLQSLILSSFGLGIAASQSSEFSFVDEVIYLKKFTGTQGSGAFEQTIRSLLEVLSKDSKKFLCIDEFEAVTEPGAAAKILTLFLTQIAKTSDFCISASHLGLEIQKFIEQEQISAIRIDGISAQGLDEKGNLITLHQPEFGKLGKSTPELILQRIKQDEKFWNNKSDKLKNLLDDIA